MVTRRKLSLDFSAEAVGLVKARGVSVKSQLTAKMSPNQESA